MRKLLTGTALVTLMAVNLSAQGIYGTLTGVVSDPSTAVVATAKITLRNAQSGSQRTTVTNNDGYFTFASVPVGTYDLSVEAKGFSVYKVAGIALSGGDRRNVDITLQVGTTAQTVEITGAADAIAPVDSGERSATLTSKELQNYVSVGSNAAEFIKIMPGFGIQNGTSVAVGIAVARYPPHRSVRAAFPHTALTLDVWRQSVHSDRDA